MMNLLWGDEPGMWGDEPGMWGDEPGMWGDEPGMPMLRGGGGVIIRR